MISPAFFRNAASEKQQASWRTDLKKSGAAGCFGDIGAPAYNLWSARSSTPCTACLTSKRVWMA
jgi:hypothetical protein